MTQTHGGILCAAAFVSACSFTLDFEEGAACDGPGVCAEGLVCRLGSCQPSGAATCGDFVVDPGEVCDDGNDVAGDGCNDTCTSTETCGNGFVDAGEACDDGNMIDTDACVTCEAARCGDGFVHEGVESCDDGDTQNGSGNNQCLSDCSGVQRCGDGATEGTEVCDDGDALDGGDGYCTADCLAIQTCGNNVVEGTEFCDDGNMDSTDACIACVTARCGDGFVQAGVEVCDDGALNGTGNGLCAFDCSALRVCGDGVVTTGEVCDDGAIVGEGSCLNDCSGFQTCGNGIEEGNEACDDEFTDACGTCNADCTGAGLGPGLCGDGVACPEFEFCDDGFTDACGSCNANCTASGSGPGVCGDGQHCPEFEACDDGFRDSCGTCNADCSSTGQGPGSCGDGELCREFETCDDGSDNGLITDSQVCRPTCDGTQQCGNALTEGTEICDDGPGEGEGFCTNDCLGVQLCGDGLRVGNEACDDANTANADACLAQCSFAPEFQVSENLDRFGREDIAFGNDQFIVTWIGSGMGRDLYYRRYDSNGVPLAGESLVHVDTNGEQSWPFAAVLTGGRFAIVFESDAAGDYDVYARVFESNGTPVGTEFRVHDDSSDQQDIPGIARLSLGGFVVLWREPFTGVFGQRFDETGVRVGTRIALSTTNPYRVSQPHAEPAPAGGFNAAWLQRDTGPSGPVYVRVRHVDSTGVGEPNDRRVTTQSDSTENHLGMDSWSDGSFVLSWDEQDSLNVVRVFARRFDAHAKALGSVIEVSGAVSETQWTDVAALNDGGFVVSWGQNGGDGIGFGVMTRRFDSSGVAVTSPQVVNRTTRGNQKTGGLATSGQDVFYVWDATVDEVDWDVDGRLLPGGVVEALPITCDWAIAFSGTASERVEVTAISAGETLRPQDGDWTVEFWARIEAIGSPQRLVGRYSSTGSLLAYGTRVDASGAIVGFLGQDSPSTSVTAGQAFPSDGLFHHVAFVRDTSLSTLRLYLDGALVGSAVDTAGNVTPTDAFLVGEGLLQSEPLNGDVDDIRVWNVARYVEEFTPVRCEAVSGQPGLVAEWLFEEGAGAIAADTSGGLNDGNLVGGVSFVSVP